MRIRRDAALVSGVLFTIAFLSLIPPLLSDALTGREPNPDLSAGWEQVAARLLSDLGVASLAIVFIGLVVTWTGYVKKVR